MNGQMLVVLLMIAGAVVYLGWQTWRTWTGHGRGCGKGQCGTAKQEEQITLIPSEELTRRIRND